MTIENCTEDEAILCLIHCDRKNTSFIDIKVGDLVNLELPYTTKFNGWAFCTGHVDSAIKVHSRVERETESKSNLRYRDLRRYIIRRGSVTPNGISLTAAEKTELGIVVAIILETLLKTNFGHLADR